MTPAPHFDWFDTIYLGTVILFLFGGIAFTIWKAYRPGWEKIKTPSPPTNHEDCRACSDWEEEEWI